MLVRNYDQNKGQSLTRLKDSNLQKKTSFKSNPRLQQLKEKIMSQRVKKLQDQLDDQQLLIQENNQEQEKMIKIFFNISKLQIQHLSLINQDFKNIGQQIANKHETQNSISDISEIILQEKPKVKFQKRIKDFSRNFKNIQTQSTSQLDRKNLIQSSCKKIDPFLQTEQNFYSKLQSLQDQHNQKVPNQSQKSSQIRKKIQMQKNQFNKIEIFCGNDKKLKESQEQFQQYFRFLQKININNNQIILNNQEISYYRVYVGKGNNNAMIESIFRRRWWWRVVDYQDKDECHCIWTQLKKQEIIEGQKSCYQPQFFEQIQNYEKHDVFDNKLLKIFNEMKYDDLLGIKQQEQFQQIENQIQQIKPNFRTIKKHTGQRCHNHLDRNYHLGNKKLLFYNIKNYCESINQNPFEYIPVTFHIQNGIDDPEYQKFILFYNKRQKCNKDLFRNQKMGKIDR